MDAALPAEDRRRISDVFATYREQGLEFHALLTRQAGTPAFISVHVLVPGSWTVQAAHDWSERVECDLRQAVSHATVTTHFEPIEDPVSHMDGELDRPCG
jgi:divalent metal cation (Fe/Co/Zn/Cd) transporter